MDLVKTGNVISEARKKKKLTQKELATKLHISDKAISKWERGLSYPDISLLIPLTEILDITLYEVLSGEKEEVEETLKNTIKYSKKEIERNKKRNRKKVFLFSIICILIFFIFGYKIFNLMFYSTNIIDKDDYLKLIEGYQIKDVEEINTTRLDDNLYIKYKGAKIKNIFDDFDYKEENDIAYYMSKEKDKYFTITLTQRYVDYIGMDIDVFGINSIVFDSIDKSNILSHIKTDLELFSYFYENRNNSVDIFSSIKEIKENYYIKNLSYTMLPGIEYITELRGDLDGYIFNITEEINKNMKEISINHDDQRYVMLTMGFNKEEILDIINTFIIEK